MSTGLDSVEHVSVVEFVCAALTGLGPEGRQKHLWQLVANVKTHGEAQISSIDLCRLV